MLSFFFLDYVKFMRSPQHLDMIKTQPLWGWVFVKVAFVRKAIGILSHDIRLKTLPHKKNQPLLG